MKKFKNIPKFIDYCIKNKGGEDAICVLRKVTKNEANIIKKNTGRDVSGFFHIMDKSNVLHILRRHGINETKKEESRGQVPVVLEDFQKSLDIINGQNLIYKGYTRQGNHAFLYQYEEDNTFYYIEEVRVGRNKLCLKSLYKKKPSR